MASILLSYAAADEHEAVRLSELLESAGHSAHRADPEKPILQKIDVVLVIWSEEALITSHVYEQARSALRTRSLVQVVKFGLVIDHLAPPFLSRTLIAIGDGEAILKEIDRVLDPTLADDELLFGDVGSGGFLHEETEMEGEELELYTDQPELYTRALRERAQRVRRAPIPSHLSRIALDREMGQLNHKIPNRMRVGVTEIVEVRLGPEYVDMSRWLQGRGQLRVEEVPNVETMTIDLYGSPGAFSIVRQSSPAQLVGGRQMDRILGARHASNELTLQPETFDEDRFSRWLWHVTPKKSGTHELIVKVSADISDSHGVATTEPYVDRIFRVKVHVNLGRASMQVLKWTAAGAVSGLAGAYTQEIWWPKLRALLVETGILG